MTDVLEDVFSAIFTGKVVEMEFPSIKEAEGFRTALHKFRRKEFDTLERQLGIDVSDQDTRQLQFTRMNAGSTEQYIYHICMREARVRNTYTFKIIDDIE